MTPEQLCERLNGVCSLNRMKATVNGKPEIIARLAGDKYQFTDLGANLASEFNAQSELNVEPPKKRARAKKVQAEDTVEAPVEAEVDDLEDLLG